MLIYVVTEDDYLKERKMAFIPVDSLDVQEHDNGETLISINGKTYGWDYQFKKIVICQGGGFIPVVLNGKVVLGKMFNLVEQKKVEQKKDGVADE